MIVKNEEHFNSSCSKSYSDVVIEYMTEKSLHTLKKSDVILQHTSADLKVELPSLSKPHDLSIWLI